jgi:hypothetical protein
MAKEKNPPGRLECANLCLRLPVLRVFREAGCSQRVFTNILTGINSWAGEAKGLAVCRASPSIEGAGEGSITEEVFQ